VAVKASRLAVSVDEYKERLSRTRKWMIEQGIDLLALNKPEHYCWISGYDPTSVFYYQQLFITADDTPPTLLCNKAEMLLCEETCWLDDVRVIWTYEDSVGRTLEMVKERGFGDKPFRLGLNLGNYYLLGKHVIDIQQRLPNAELVDVDQGIDDLRLVNSPAEIDYLRRAAHIADLGVTAGINAIREGIMDREVMAEIQYALALNGCEFSAYPTLVDARGTLHGTPTGQILRTGDVIYLEVAGVKRRYHCNISRTVCVGEPAPQVRKFYELVKDILNSATEMLSPGNRTSDIVKFVDERYAEYRQYTWGRFGFSMGIGYPPVWNGGLLLMKGDDHVIEAGMVITMEPGLAYHDGATMMLGNNVLVTDHGPEVLNNVPIDLFVK
jgi:Xaa-Pro aminopeptidase